MRRCIDKKRGLQVHDPRHIKVFPAKTIRTEKCERCGLWIKRDEKNYKLEIQND